MPCASCSQSAFFRGKPVVVEVLAFGYEHGGLDPECEPTEPHALRSAPSRRVIVMGDELPFDATRVPKRGKARCGERRRFRRPANRRERRDHGFESPLRRATVQPTGAAACPDAWPCMGHPERFTRSACRRLGRVAWVQPSTVHTGEVAFVRCNRGGEARMTTHSRLVAVPQVTTKSEAWEAGKARWRAHGDTFGGGFGRRDGRLCSAAGRPQFVLRRTTSRLFADGQPDARRGTSVPL